MVDREYSGFGVRVGESHEGETVGSNVGKAELEEEEAYRSLLWKEEGEKDILEEDCDSDDDVL